ncbi:MAG: ThiF family adenylyltransferase [Lachnospiraceae bacterium]|nr:ThiF family adenylyltransferase [Lachnospiraceae bacterium]
MINYNIVCVGCGGTGSAFLQKLARYQASSKEIINVAVIDGDIVEQKNLIRQNFFSGDIRKKKANCIIDLASCSYGVNWFSYPDYLVDSKQIAEIFNSMVSNNNMNINMLVGCVDNHNARRVMESWFEKQNNCFYIDSANDEYDGEVIVSCMANSQEVSPRRSFYFPDVLTDETPSVVELSCEQRNISSPQHQTTNDMAGNIILSVVSQIINRNVPTGMILFDSKEFICKRLAFSDGKLVVDP